MVQVVTLDLSSLDSLKEKAEEIIQVTEAFFGQHTHSFSSRCLASWMYSLTVRVFRSGVVLLKLCWRFIRE